MLSFRWALRRPWRVSHRSLGTKPRVTIWDEPIPAGHTLDSVRPPKYWQAPPATPPDPHAYERNPVTSAHAIDHSHGKVSARDSAALSPSGTVVHGRYGDLGPDVAQSIPLEYLALLRPAAEGAAAVRALSASSKGTLLVYGASQPSGLSAVQLGASAGHAVVAVVGGEHSGNEEMVDVVKGLAPEPGTAVPEEYALVKKNFSELVDAAMNGQKEEPVDAELYVKDFKGNLLDYAATYPETLPAAVDEAHITFEGKDKDRANFRDNIDPYLHQFPAGSPPFNPDKLDSSFPKDQYAIFKGKFHAQTTAVISGDEEGNQFQPPHLVQAMMASPESPPKPSSDFYEFSILKTTDGVPPAKGGPLVGAVIVVTPALEVAAKATEEAGPALRSKAEALQFLTASQRNAFSAAMSVVSLAQQHGAPIYVVGGSLPGLNSVEPTDEDVQEALSAMEVEEDGSSRLNYFIQVYRAGDFPIYSDYAVHRASEELSGPRQIVVTK